MDIDQHVRELLKAILTKCQTPCEKIIHETKKNQGAEFAESVTTMYELMKELGVVRE